jgi:hypothetical protein
MRDLMSMMSKAKELQDKMQALQEELAGMTAEGVSGAGLVTVTVSGRNELKSVRIDPSLLKPDEGEILEDLIVAAHNDARTKAEQMAADKMRELTGGLGLPPGLKLPF